MTDIPATPPGPATPPEAAAGTPTRHGYSSTQIAYHWIIVGLVVANWLIGGAMAEVFDARREGETIWNYGPAFVHIAFGLVIFGVMIARLRARLARPVETAAGTKHPIMALLGRINHLAFYVVLLAMPPLGALAWFFGAGWAAALHSLLAWVLPILIVLHIGGAVVHLFLGENILRRMLRPTAGT